MARLPLSGRGERIGDELAGGDRPYACRRSLKHDDSHFAGLGSVGWARKGAVDVDGPSIVGARGVDVARLRVGRGPIKLLSCEADRCRKRIGMPGMQHRLRSSKRAAGLVGPASGDGDKRDGRCNDSNPHPDHSTVRAAWLFQPGHGAGASAGAGAFPREGRRWLRPLEREHEPAHDRREQLPRRPLAVIRARWAIRDEI